jgi:hypothetical protein
VGSFYYVSGSYPHASQFYYETGRGHIKENDDSLTKYQKILKEQATTQGKKADYSNRILRLSLSVTNPNAQGYNPLHEDPSDPGVGHHDIEKGRQQQKKANKRHDRPTGLGMVFSDIDNPLHNQNNNNNQQPSSSSTTQQLLSSPPPPVSVPHSSSSPLKTTPLKNNPNLHVIVHTDVDNKHPLEKMASISPHLAPPPFLLPEMNSNNNNNNTSDSNNSSNPTAKSADYVFVQDNSAPEEEEDDDDDDDDDDDEEKTAAPTSPLKPPAVVSFQPPQLTEMERLEIASQQRNHSEGGNDDDDEEDDEMSFLK